MLLGLAAKQLGVPCPTCQVRGGVVSSKSDPSKKRHLRRAARRQAVLGPEHGPGAAEAGHGVPARRQAGEAEGHRGEGARARIRTCTSSGCRGCCTAASSARRARGRSPSPTRCSRSTRARSRTSRAPRSYRKGDFIGVVAANEQDAIQAAAQLKVRWSESKTMPGSGNLWKHFREAKSAERFTRNIGSIDKGLAGAANDGGAELLDLLPVARVVRPLVRRRRRPPGQGRRLGREPGHLRQPQPRVGAARRAVPEQSPSTSPRARAATGRTCRTTRRSPRR